jgi:hypothetical protein
MCGTREGWLPASGGPAAQSDLKSRPGPPRRGSQGVGALPRADPEADHYGGDEEQEVADGRPGPIIPDRPVDVYRWWLPSPAGKPSRAARRIDALRARGGAGRRQTRIPTSRRTARPRWRRTAPGDRSAPARPWRAPHRSSLAGQRLTALCRGEAGNGTGGEAAHGRGLPR